MKKIRSAALILAVITALAAFTGILAGAEEITFKPEITDGKLYGIPENTTVANAKAAFPKTIFELIDETDLIATGKKVRINGNELTAVVMGDLDGNGKLDPNDYLLLRRAFLGTADLEGVYLEAAGVAVGEEITPLDYMLLKRAYFGTYNLNKDYTVDAYDPAEDESGWTSEWV